MKEILALFFKNSDLILNTVGTLFIAISVGVPENYMEYVSVNPVTKKEKRAKIAAVLHPMLFKLGCILTIVGFLIAISRR